MEKLIVLKEQEEEEDFGDKLGLFENEQYELVLVHLENFKKYLKRDLNIKSTDIIASSIVLRDSDNQCLNAKQVAFIAASPKFKGAGSIIQAIASQYYGTDLTSDRKSGSSSGAKAAWKKIEQGAAGWSKTGVLDNYYGNKQYWLQTDKNNNFFWSTGPMTPDPKDDCPIPPNPNKLGTLDAYRYTGSTNTQEYLNSANEFMKFAKEKMQMSISDVFSKLKDLGEDLWSKVYKAD